MSDTTIGPRIETGEEGAASFMRAPMVKQQFPDFDDAPGPVVPPEAASAATTSASVPAAAAAAAAAAVAATAAAAAPAAVQADDEGEESPSDEPASADDTPRAKVAPAAGAGQKQASADARNRGPTTLSRSVMDSEVKRQSHSSERYEEVYQYICCESARGFGEKESAHTPMTIG